MSNPFDPIPTTSTSKHDQLNNDAVVDNHNPFLNTSTVSGSANVSQVADSNYNFEVFDPIQIIGIITD